MAANLIIHIYTLIDNMCTACNHADNYVLRQRLKMLSIIKSFFSNLAYVLSTPIHYALHKAIDKGYTRIAWAISFLPIDLNRSYNGHTPLQRATKNGNTAIEIELLKIKTVKNNAAANLYLPQELLTIPAIIYNDPIRNNIALNFDAKLAQVPINPELLKILSETNDGATGNNRYQFFNTNNRNFPVMQELFWFGVGRHPVDLYQSSLYKACRRGDLSMVQELLTIRAVIDQAAAYNDGALNEAASNGHTLIVHAIIRAIWPDGYNIIPKHITPAVQKSINKAMVIRGQLVVEFKKFQNLNPTYSSELLPSSNESNYNISSLPVDMISRILQFLYPVGCEKLKPIVLMFKHHIAHERISPKLADLAVDAAESVLARENKKTPALLS